MQPFNWLQLDLVICMYRWYESCLNNPSGGIIHVIIWSSKHIQPRKLNKSFPWYHNIKSIHCLLVDSRTIFSILNVILLPSIRSVFPDAMRYPINYSQNIISEGTQFLQMIIESWNMPQKILSPFSISYSFIYVPNVEFCYRYPTLNCAWLARSVVCRDPLYRNLHVLLGNIKLDKCVYSY